jgi:adenylosuccinate synthase
MIKAGIFGGSGYTGFETIKILQKHPQVQITFATSESSAGQILSDLYPVPWDLPLIPTADAPLDQADAVFCCLPHGASMPAVMAARQAGARVIDLSADFRLANPDVYQKWYGLSHEAPEMLAQAVYGIPEINRAQVQTATLLAPYVKDAGRLIREALQNNRTVVAEGAQGTLLDIDQGTYPFVTSSTTTAAGVFAGLGLGIVPVNRVIGVTKAFQTRVGAGPFPTEESDETASRLRGTGANPWDEFGTTTGRPRRVGWLDAVLLRYAASVNGLTELVLTKMDILSGFDKIKICTAYKVGRKTFDLPPYGVDGAQLDLTQPVYQILPGWQEDLTTMRTTEELPAAARGYVRAIEGAVGLPVKLVSVGPERDQIIPF